MLELDWIENIDIQYGERPIPNFFKLLSKSVEVDSPLQDGDIVTLEEGIQIYALATQGHSHGSMSFVLNDEVIFIGDAIPVAHDLPIFVDFEQAGILQYVGNPLVLKSIDACKKYLFQME